MEAPDVRYATTGDGVRVAFSTMGKGPPLIWLPELAFSHLSVEWDQPGTPETYAVLSKHHQLIRIDLRNEGLSSRGIRDVSDADFVTDVLAVMDRLQLTRSSLWAVSGRARVAVALAALHPERVDRLVLFSTWLGGVSPPGFAQTLATLYPIARRSWKQYSELVTTALVGLDDPNSTAAVAKLHQASINFDDYRHAVAARNGSDVWGLLERVQSPTLVLHREDEHTFSLESAQRVVGELPNGVLRVLSTPEASESMWSLKGTLPPTIEFLTGGSHSVQKTDVDAFRTILFTDVVASTPLLAQLKDEKMRAVMRDHDEVLEAAVTDHGGRVIKTIGDAFMAEFAVPSGAVEAAIAAQRGIRDKFADSDVPIRLRIGINAGEPIEEDGDLHGASVVIAKRLESEAENGGILVSDVVRSAVAGKEFEFVDRGEVSLKGFDEPVRAWSVEW